MYMVYSSYDTAKCTVTQRKDTSVYQCSGYELIGIASRRNTLLAWIRKKKHLLVASLVPLGTFSYCSLDPLGTFS